MKQQIAFAKAVKVIESCTNESHLEGAYKYLNNFFNVYQQTMLHQALLLEYTKKQVILELTNNPINNY